MRDPRLKRNNRELLQEEGAQTVVSRDQRTRNFLWENWLSGLDSNQDRGLQRA